jgi:tetratricopeptide (TPR) repeat protein
MQKRRKFKLEILIFMVVSLVTGYANICSGEMRPVTSSDVIGRLPVGETTLCLENVFIIPAPSVGRSYILPGGYYRPTHVDEHGVYYAAPNGLLERLNGKEKQLSGGIHMPNKSGQYYSFLSLYIVLKEDDFPKLPLIDDKQKGIGSMLAFTWNGQDIKDASKTPRNELPMYGGFEKNQKQKEADELFIRDIVSKAGSREKGSEEVAKTGWTYFYKDDLSTAMKRFNQAWLLDQKNPASYWGFGVVLANKNKYQQARVMLEKAYELAPDNARLITDMAHHYSLMGRGYMIDRNSIYEGMLKKADALFLKASQLEPDYVLIYINWAVNNYYHSDYKEAWDNIAQVRKHGGEQSLNPDFLKALQDAMPDPYKK